MLASVLLLAGCISDTRLTPSTPAAGAITGLVVFDDGTPAAAVEVETEGASTLTDDEGGFELPNLPPNPMTRLRTHPPGGTMTSKFVAVDENATTYADLRVIALRHAQLDDAAAGGRVVTEDGLELDFVANGLVTDAGEPVTGPVDVAFALLNTYESMAFAPGNLLAVDDFGDTKQLISNGMVEVTLAQGDTPIQLAANALLSFPTMGLVEGGCGSDFGLFGFDEELGAWRAAGEGVLENGRFTASVEHFSYWNCDRTVRYEGCADATLTLGGQAVVRSEVGVWLSDYTQQVVTSDANGAIRIQVPLGRTVSVLAVYDADYSIEAAEADGFWSLGTVTASEESCPDLGTLDANGIDADGDGEATFPWGADCNDHDADATGADPCSTFKSNDTGAGDTGRGDCGTGA